MSPPLLSGFFCRHLAGGAIGPCLCFPPPVSYRAHPAPPPPAPCTPDSAVHPETRVFRTKGSGTTRIPPAPTPRCPLHPRARPLWCARAGSFFSSSWPPWRSRIFQSGCLPANSEIFIKQQAFPPPYLILPLEGESDGKMKSGDKTASLVARERAKKIIADSA